MGFVSGVCQDHALQEVYGKFSSIQNGLEDMFNPSKGIDVKRNFPFAFVSSQKTTLILSVNVAGRNPITRLKMS